MAYANMMLLMAGTVLCLSNKDREPFPKLLIAWYLFFLLYYGIGMIANVVHGFEAPYLKTLVPIFYFIGFSLFLGDPKNRFFFRRMLIISFTLANLLLIYFMYINFDLDLKGITEYTLERAGGVYGDANNAAVVCLLSIIWIEHFFKPINIFQKIMKLLGLGIALYALFLTFSKTGFLVLIIICVLLYQKHITPTRILALILILPVSIFFMINLALSSPSLSTVQKSRIQDVFNILTLNTSDVSYSRRDVLLDNMVGYIQKNPFFGNGVYFSTEIMGHNTVVGVWADAGVFVFIAFLALLVAFVIKTLSQQNTGVKFFVLSMLFVLYVFMLTLQTIINQGYLLVLFVYMSYVLVRQPVEVSDNTDNNVLA
jgi:hypothetical protein